jgi:hypothetical protein
MGPRSHSRGSGLLSLVHVAFPVPRFLPYSSYEPSLAERRNDHMKEHRIRFLQKISRIQNCADTAGSASGQPLKSIPVFDDQFTCARV